MTAVTLSTTKADVMAAKKELQDRLPTARAIGIKVGRVIDKANKRAFVLCGTTIGFAILANIFSDISAGDIAFPLFVVSSLATLALYIRPLSAINRFDQALAADKANGRIEMPEDQIDAYREVVSAYAAARRAQRLQAA